jgi:hypothetical protein
MENCKGKKNRSFVTRSISSCRSIGGTGQNQIILGPTPLVCGWAFGFFKLRAYQAHGLPLATLFCFSCAVFLVEAKYSITALHESVLIKRDDKEINNGPSSGIPANAPW